MATVYVQLHSANSQVSVPMINSVPVNKTSLTSSASAQRADISALGRDHKNPSSKQLYWTIIPIGGDVWVEFGPNRNLAAAAGTTHLCKAGQVSNFAVSNANAGHEYVSIIDA